MVFEDKKRIQIQELKEMSLLPSYVEKCEREYSERVDGIAAKIVEAGVPVVLVTGPSASGKTTSSKRLARSMTRLGKKTSVLSLDNFFKNLEDYPKQKNGEPDFEHLHALDVDAVNRCLNELTTTGSTWIPMFDFVTHKSVPHATEVRVDDSSAVVIEGIHALNPELSIGVNPDLMIKIYAGLRTEYYESRKRVIATRDLRITRRIIRDERDRGHSPEGTLALWKNIMAGEEKWIKPFKPDADYLLNTALDYEPCLYGADLEKMFTEGKGGKFSDELGTLAENFGKTGSVSMDLVPSDSLLREFIGGLDLGES
ncbi:MAG: nucleoside kinase [Oscillospiraceae bacterium]|nr:nucleoside kinase [Oscillospiraceae bacterium]